MNYIDKGDNRPPFLVCQNARRGFKCQYVPYPYAEFEKHFLNYVKELDVSSFGEQSQKSKRLEEITTLEGKIEENKEKIANTMKLIFKMVDPPEELGEAV
jgi:hypothetical protein